MLDLHKLTVAMATDEVACGPPRGAVLLSIYLFIHLLIYLFIYLFVYLFLHFSISLFYFFNYSNWQQRHLSSAVNLVNNAVLLIYIGLPSYFRNVPGCLSVFLSFLLSFRLVAQTSQRRRSERQCVEKCTYLFMYDVNILKRQRGKRDFQKYRQ